MITIGEMESLIKSSSQEPLGSKFYMIKAEIYMGQELKFIWKLPDIEEIQVCSNHDPRGYDGAPIGDQSFTYDYIGKIFKNLLLKNYWARKAEKLYMEADPDIVEIQVCSNHDPRGNDGATIGDQSFTYDYIGKIFKNLLLKNYWAQLPFKQVCSNHDLPGVKIYVLQNYIG